MDTFSNINQTSIFRKLTAVITDKNSGKEIQLDNTLIRELEISYKDFDVYGFIIIDDLYSVMNNINLGSEAEISINLTDLYEVNISRTFNILSKTSKKQQNFNYIRLELRDSISYKLDNLFISKSYQNIKLSDIFSEYKKYIDYYINKDKIKFNIDQTKLERKLYSVNQTKSFLDFITEDLRKEGYILYQDRDSVNLKDSRNLGSTKLEFQVEEYIEKTNNEFYGFRILEYKQLSNPEFKLKQPKTECLVYDPATKTFKHFKQNLNDIESDIKINENDNNTIAQNTEGIKYITREYLDDNSLYLNTLERFIRDNQIEFVTQGNLNLPKIYTNIKLNISGNLNIEESQDKGDQRLSGYYICTQKTDKIINGEYFIQKIIASRLNDGIVK